MEEAEEFSRVVIIRGRVKSVHGSFCSEIEQLIHFAANIVCVCSKGSGHPVTEVFFGSVLITREIDARFSGTIFFGVHTGEATSKLSDFCPGVITHGIAVKEVG